MRSFFPITFARLEGETFIVVTNYFQGSSTCQHVLIIQMDNSMLVAANVRNLPSYLLLSIW